MEFQKTIKKVVYFSGISLHVGDQAAISFHPAEPNTGVVFVRTDLDPRPSVHAKLENVTGVTRGTTIEENGVKVHTIEHVLAALMGCGIDNLIIEMNASEPPVGDGSALPFVEMIQAAGVQEQRVPKTYFDLLEPVWHEENGASIVALPYAGFRVSYILSYKDTKLKDQYMSLVIDQNSFKREIAPSRTFCFYNEVEYLMEQGLIKGGSLDNAVVVGKDAIFSKEKLRFPDECVRHKILDVMGDIFLLGSSLRAHLIAVKTGHSMNFQMTKRLYQLCRLSIEGKKEQTSKT